MKTYLIENCAVLMHIGNVYPCRKNSVTLQKYVSRDNHTQINDMIN